MTRVCLFWKIRGVYLVLISCVPFPLTGSGQLAASVERRKAGVCCVLTKRRVGEPVSGAEWPSALLACADVLNRGVCVAPLYELWSLQLWGGISKKAFLPFASSSWDVWNSFCVHGITVYFINYGAVTWWNTWIVNYTSSRQRIWSLKNWIKTTKPQQRSCGYC